MDTSPVLCLVAQLCPTLCDPMDCSPPGSCLWDSPGKNTGVGGRVLLYMSLLANGRVLGQKIAMVLLTSPHFLLVTRVSIRMHPDA